MLRLVHAFGFSMTTLAIDGLHAVTIGTSQRLFGRYHLVVDGRVHPGLYETMLPEILQAFRFHSLPDGPVPIEMIPETVFKFLPGPGCFFLNHRAAKIKESIDYKHKHIFVFDNK